MHWLLVLALLSSTTDIKDQNASGSALNRLAENVLRQKLGNSVRNLHVDLKRGQGRGGDFDYFNVTVDGFTADRLLDLERRTTTSDGTYSDNTDYGNNNGDVYPELRFRRAQQLGPQAFDLGDIFNGDLGGIFNGGIGDILGGGLSSQGRIGRLQINAANFSFGGATYDGLQAGLGEIKFDWLKALEGDFDIKSVRPGNLGLQLRAEQAQRLIAPRLPSVKDVRLRFDDGLAYVGGKAVYLGVGVPFEAGGRLSVQTNEVRADDLRLSISKLRLPSFVVNEITKSVNPLYDFDPDEKWPIAVNLSTAAADNNVLGMRGGLEWLGFNRHRDSQRNPDNRNRNDDQNDPYDLPYRIPLPE